MSAPSSGMTTPTLQKSGSAAEVEAIRQAMSAGEETDQENYGTDDGGDNAEEDTTEDRRPPKTGKLRSALYSCDLKSFWALQDKGSISNFITFFIMLVGIIGASQHGNSLFWLSIRALGLFGFSGGITNWLAVKMLFDRVPYLAGSGVITKQFKEIRQTVMDTVLETFFDAAFLGKYIADKAVQMENSDFLRSRIAKILDSAEVDELIEKHLAALMAKPEGMMLAMVGMTPQSMKPMVKPFVTGMDVEIAPLITSQFDPSKMVDTYAIRDQVQELMKTKMEMLTPEMVKALVEEMIRTHLGWLVVWGNLFGGLLGLICQIATWDFSK